MNLGTMVTKVRDKLGESSENFFKDVAIKEDLNDSLRTFCAEERWTWLQAVQTGTVASAAVVLTSAPAGIDASRQAILSIVPTAGDTQIRQMRRVSLMQAAKLEASYSTAASAGVEPQYYYMRTASADSLATLVPTLVPKADKGYNFTLFYFRLPAALSADGDIPAIPVLYHEALVARTAGLQWLKELNAGTKAQEQFMLYAEKLELARQDEQQVAIDEPLTWGGEDPEYRVGGADYFGIHMPPTF